VSTRRYLFAVVDGGGNVPPELGAARVLVDRDHAVMVLAEDSVAADVQAAGAVLRRWERAPNRPDRSPANDPSRDWECKYPWQLVDALGTLPVRAVVTTGPALDPAALRPPANVTVVPSAPHRQVLQHAALVVTHGGHGTVMKALAAGVPMVVLPHGRDQADTAARVTTRGAGVVLKRSAGPSRIADAVMQVLGNDSYRAAARHLGEAVRRDARSHALIHELEGIPLVRNQPHDATSQAALDRYARARPGDRP
jgi:hypothetical protein